MAAIWLTPEGNLGVIPELEYYQFKIDAYNPGGGSVTYSVIAGSLPTGLHIDQQGNVQGVPIHGNEALLEGVPSSVNKVTTSTFTVRITNQSNQVTDRTFSLTVAGLTPPQIVPKNVELGDFFDGDLVHLQLYAVEFNPNLTVTWELINGDLPPGVTLTSDGLLSGYIDPAIPPDGYQPGWAEQGWDLVEWDFLGENVSKNYKFTVTAFDGINYDSSTYTIYVYAKANMTADNDILSVDNESVVTADSDTLHKPVILTLDQEFPDIRQNERHDFQIKAKDYEADAILWRKKSGSFPPGMTLNTTNGWITGFVPAGALSNTTYTFEIEVYKRDLPQYVSEPITYTVRLLGLVDSTVTWLTDADLGSIDNGAIADSSVSATTPSGKALFYRIPAGSNSKLPQGLRLLSDGTISGRVAFETFKFDGGDTTFEDSLTTFDKEYTFDVQVYDPDGYINDTKTFTITVNASNTIPYENLFIQALPSKEQRDIYNSIINDSDIFPISDIYKVNDPWFGKNTLLRSLFLTGINPSQISDYISAMTRNHYWKKINFGELKTARALDNNFNVKYEVVYVELNDNQVNQSGESVGANVALTSNTENISYIYPNSFTNMVSQFNDNIGYANKSILPDWMTSRQEDGRVLGFTRALVLCYTKPGKSKPIAYRVESKLDQLQQIDFTIDRYELDGILSSYYNLDNDSFVNYYDATGNIYVSSNSNVVTGSFSIDSGNISFSNTSTTVTGGYTTDSGTITTNTSNAYVFGNSTSFLTELQPGQVIKANGTVIGTISTIFSSNILRLSANCTANVSSVAYGHNNTIFLAELSAGQLLKANNTVIGTVANIVSNSTITLTANATTTESNIAYGHNNTLFARELAVGQILVANDVEIGRVQQISTNASLILFANSTITANNVSYSHTIGETTFDRDSTIAGVTGRVNVSSGSNRIYGTYTSMSGNITTLTNSNVVTGTYTSGTGQISYTSIYNTDANVTVTYVHGNVTAFATEIEQGSLIYANNTIIGTVYSVLSNDDLVIRSNGSHLVSNTANISFEYSTTKFEKELAVGDHIISNGSYVGTVESITNAGSLILEANAKVEISDLSYGSKLTTQFADEISSGSDIYINGVDIGYVTAVSDDYALTISDSIDTTSSNIQIYHSISDSTTFDYNQTRFYTSKITYTTPSEGDKYLKFPQIGVLE